MTAGSLLLILKAKSMVSKETQSKLTPKARIKVLWKEHHGNSKVDISQYDLLYVDASKQSTV
jgi:hypothetical protein